MKFVFFFSILLISVALAAPNPHLLSLSERFKVEIAELESFNDTDNSKVTIEKGAKVLKETHDDIAEESLPDSPMNETAVRLFRTQRSDMLPSLERQERVFLPFINEITFLVGSPQAQIEFVYPPLGASVFSAFHILIAYGADGRAKRLLGPRIRVRSNVFVLATITTNTDANWNFPAAVALYNYDLQCLVGFVSYGSSTSSPINRVDGPALCPGVSPIHVPFEDRLPASGRYSMGNVGTGAKATDFTFDGLFQSTFVRANCRQTLLKGAARATGPNCDPLVPSVTPTPTASITTSPTTSPSSSPSATATITSTPSPTISETSSPTVSLTPTITSSASPTISESSSPTISVTPTVTSTSSPTISESASPTISETATITPSVSPTTSPSASPTISETPSITPSSSATITSTPSPTISETPSISPSASATITSSASPTITSTSSSSITPSSSPTISETSSPTVSFTSSITPSSSPTISGTASPTVSETASPSLTATPTITSTPSVSSTASPSESAPSTAPVEVCTDVVPNNRVLASRKFSRKDAVLQYLFEDLTFEANVRVFARHEGDEVFVEIRGRKRTQIKGGTFFTSHKALSDADVEARFEDFDTTGTENILSLVESIDESGPLPAILSSCCDAPINFYVKFSACDGRNQRRRNPNTGRNERINGCSVGSVEESVTVSGIVRCARA